VETVTRPDSLCPQAKEREKKRSFPPKKQTLRNAFRDREGWEGVSGKKQGRSWCGEKHVWQDGMSASRQVDEKKEGSSIAKKG